MRRVFYSVLLSLFFSLFVLIALKSPVYAGVCEFRGIGHGYYCKFYPQLAEQEYCPEPWYDDYDAEASHFCCQQVWEHSSCEQEFEEQTRQGRACWNGNLNCPAGYHIETNQPLDSFCSVNGFGQQMCSGVRDALWGATVHEYSRMHETLRCKFEYSWQKFVDGFQQSCSLAL